MRNKCIVCDKNIYRGGQTGTKGARTIRREDSITCSKQCSKVYSRIYKYIKEKYFRRRK